MTVATLKEIDEHLLARSNQARREKLIFCVAMTLLVGVPLVALLIFR